MTLDGDWRSPTKEEEAAILEEAFRAGTCEEFTFEGRTDYERLVDSFEGVGFAIGEGRIDLGDTVESPLIRTIKSEYRRGRREAQGG